MEHNLYNLLLRSFDGSLSETEQQRLNTLLDSSSDVRSVREEIGRLRSGLRVEKDKTFQPFFAERVVNRLNSRRQSTVDYFVAAFRTVAIGAAVLVIIFSAYNISRENSFTVDSALGIHHQSLQQILALETPFE